MSITPEVSIVACVRNTLVPLRITPVAPTGVDLTPPPRCRRWQASSRLWPLSTLETAPLSRPRMSRANSTTIEAPGRRCCCSASQVRLLLVLLLLLLVADRE